MSEELEEETKGSKEGARAIEKKKKEEKRISDFYEMNQDQLKRLRPTCERCGPGYFMAQHQDRFTCGHCGLTRYKPAETRSESLNLPDR